MQTGIMLQGYSSEDFEEFLKKTMKEILASTPPSEPEEEGLLNCIEAAKFCGFSKPTLAKLTKEGYFKPLGKRKTKRYRKVDLISGMEKCAEEKEKG
jgi:hypothetical protein